MERKESAKTAELFIGVKTTKQKLFRAASIVLSIAVSLKFISILRAKGLSFPLSYSITAIIFAIIATHALSIRTHKRSRIEVNFRNLFAHRLSLYLTSFVILMVYSSLFYLSNKILLNFGELLFLIAISITFGSVSEEIH